MVSYCNDCQRYVNQTCDRCGESFGIAVCEKYACGGHMKCPFCGGRHLTAKKEFGPDPYDFRGRQKVLGHVDNEKMCSGCNAKIGSTEWKFCPWCGKLL